MTVNELINSVANEIDAFHSIDASYFLMWYKSIRMILAKDVDKFEKVAFFADEQITQQSSHTGITEAKIILDGEIKTYQIIKVVIREHEDSADVVLSRSTIKNETLLTNIYFNMPRENSSDVIGIVAYTPTYGEIQSVDIYYVDIPTITINSFVDNDEFLGMYRSYLRGEAYKLINEDELAAKWIGDFNSQLAIYKAAIDKQHKEAV